MGHWVEDKVFGRIYISDKELKAMEIAFTNRNKDNNYGKKS